MNPYATTADQLNSEVFCRHAPSKINGVGVIAIRPIPKGTRYNPMWNEFRQQMFSISHEEWRKVKPEIQDIILSSGAFNDHDANHYICAHPNYNHTFFVNHSDDPNTKDGVALRDISPGEEITRYCDGVHYEVIKHFARQGIIIKNQT